MPTSATSRLTNAQSGSNTQSHRQQKSNGPSSAVRYRIHGVKKIALLSLAVLLDTLPLAGLIVSGAFFASAASNIAAEGSSLSACMGANSGSLFWDAASFAFNTMTGGAKIFGCLGYHAPDALTSLAGGGVFLVLTPATYFVISFFTAVISPLLFLILFFMCGYNPVGVKMKKIALNITSFVSESLPFFNILPMITINVFMHIRFSQQEDRKRSKKKRAKWMT